MHNKAVVLAAMLLLAGVPAFAAIFGYPDEATFRAGGGLTEINFDLTPCNQPINAPSPGVLAGSIYASAGVTFASGVIFDESPFATPPSSPNILTNTAINTPTPSLIDATFSTPVHRFGLHNFGGTAVLRLYDAGGHLLATFRIDSSSPFVGLGSGIAIARFTYDYESGSGFGLDSLLFDTIVVTPCSPSAPIGTLITTVGGLNVPQGIRTSLVAKLDAAVTAADAGDIDTACGNLRAFSNEVSAQAGKKLGPADAKALLQAVDDVRKQLGCG